MKKSIKHKYKIKKHSIGPSFGKYIMPIIVIFFVVSGLTFAHLRGQNNRLVSEVITKEAKLTQKSSIEENVKNLNTQDKPEPSPQPQATISVKNTSKSSTSQYVPAAGGSSIIRNGRSIPAELAACPDSFFPPANMPSNSTFQLPMPEIKQVPQQTIYLQPGQQSVSYSYKSPDGLPVTDIYNINPSPQQSANWLQKSISLSAGSYNLRANAFCVQYDIPITVTYPEIYITNISYDDATNSVRYAANVAPENFNIRYDIIGCQSPNWAECSGEDTVAASGANGSIALDPLFPELDNYFENNQPQSVSITITPRRNGYSTTRSSGLTFSW